MLYRGKIGKGLVWAVETIFYKPFRWVGIELFRV
jgi:hypothetical protein